jgi:hypothetical protein
MNKEKFEKLRGHVMNEGEYEPHIDLDFENIVVKAKCARCGKYLDGIMNFAETIPVVLVEPCKNCIKKKG